MKINIDDIGGILVKEDDRYIVKDNTDLNNLVVSSTNLNPGKQTTGHKHAGQEEVYIFVKGMGRMLLGTQDGDNININKDDDKFVKGRCFILRPGDAEYNHVVQYEFHNTMNAATE